MLERTSKPGQRSCLRFCAAPPPDFAIFNVSVCADVRHDVILEEDVSESTHTHSEKIQSGMCHI